MVESGDGSGSAGGDGGSGGCGGDDMEKGNHYDSH